MPETRTVPPCVCVAAGRPMTEAGVLHLTDCQWLAWFRSSGGCQGDEPAPASLRDEVLWVISTAVTCSAVLIALTAQRWDTTLAACVLCFARGRAERHAAARAELATLSPATRPEATDG